MAISYGNPSEGTEESAGTRPSPSKLSSARQSLWTDVDCDSSGPDQSAGAALARVIESEVVPRLLLAHQARRPIPVAGVAAGAARRIFGVNEIDRFVTLALNQDAAVIAGHLEALAAEGTPVETLYLDLIAPAARRIGQLWEEDICSFVDVTIALSRLHQVLHRVGLRPAPDQQVPAKPAPRALFVPAPEEQHTFGLVMLAEFFRKDGWDARAETAADPAETLALIESESFDLVGFTVACEEHVAGLKALIGRIRARSRNRNVTVMAGGRLVADHPALATELNVDAAARDGAEAVSIARSLMTERGVPASIAESHLSR